MHAFEAPQLTGVLFQALLLGFLFVYFLWLCLQGHSPCLCSACSDANSTPCAFHSRRSRFHSRTSMCGLGNVLGLSLLPCPSPADCRGDPSVPGLPVLGGSPPAHAGWSQGSIRLSPHPGSPRRPAQPNCLPPPQSGQPRALSRLPPCAAVVSWRSRGTHLPCLAVGETTLLFRGTGPVL